MSSLMGGTYKATGINLKSVPMGESDRLLTILTREHGLIRAIAPGARKSKSSLRGRSNLFVINDLLIARGRSLDKMIQADSIESFVGLSSDLGKLTAGQYLSELVLCQALSDHPQPDLFALLWEHLTRIDQRTASQTLLSLIQGIFHLLAHGGLTPQVFRCCLTQQAIIPDGSNPEWMAYFDASSGGLIAHAMPDEASSDASYSDSPQIAPDSRNPSSAERLSAQSPPRASRYQPFRVLEGRTPYSSRSASTSTAMNADAVNADSMDVDFMDVDSTNTLSSAHRSSLSFSLRDGDRGDRPQISTSGRSPRDRRNSHPLAGAIQLTAQEVEMLQRLAQPDILNNSDGFAASTLLSIERVLRQYAQYHFEKTIRSAELIETCFAAYEL